jgi:hypothetical protein
VLSQRLVPIRDKNMIGTQLLSFKVRAILVSHAFERDVYIQQMSLLFRRHGLNGSLDSLEKF